MAKKNLKSGEKSALVHLASGKCYNPDCTELLFVQRGPHYIVNYEIAHIRDELAPANEASDVGWRYWPKTDMTQEQRNQYGNLILLCGACHKVVDQIEPRSFSPELLHEWKQSNEGNNAEHMKTLLESKPVTEADLERLLREGLNAFHAKRKADISVMLKVGLFFGIDSVTGNHEVIYSPLVERVEANLNRLYGDFEISITNTSDFPITLNETGFRLPDGSALRIVGADGTRIDSRGEIDVRYSIDKMIGSQHIKDVQHLYANTVCGAEATCNDQMVKTFLKFIETGHWSPVRDYPY